MERFGNAVLPQQQVGEVAVDVFDSESVALLDGLRERSQICANCFNLRDRLLIKENGEKI